MSLDFQYEQKLFLSLQRVQAGYGAHLTSCSKGTGSSSLGIKQPRLEAEHRTPTSTEIKCAYLRNFGRKNSVVKFNSEITIVDGQRQKNIPFRKGVS
jgi:hypothetical protein